MMRWWRCPHCRGNRIAHYWPCMKAWRVRCGRRPTAESILAALSDEPGEDQ